MTKIQLISGVVYTDLSPEEVRQYLQGASRGGAFPGFVDEQRTQSIYIAVHAVEYIYR